LEGIYRVQNDGLSEFELIGILECLVFEMKSARRQTLPDKKTDAAAVAATVSQEITGQPEEAPQETSKETVQSPASSAKLLQKVKMFHRISSNSFIY